MPIRLLEHLCCAYLPMNIDEDDDIEKGRVLRAAKLIEANIPPVLNQRGRTTYAGHAIVMCVTAGGKEAAAMRIRAPGSSENYFPRPMSSTVPVQVTHVIEPTAAAEN